MIEYSETEQVFLLKTACWTVRRRLEATPGPVAVPPITPVVMRPAGCFVSLHRRTDHALRGCIGRIDTAAPLLEALINVSWGSAADPRFANQPLTLAELPSLTVELSILGPLKPAQNPLDFEPLTDGIYMVVGQRSGVFLPQVAQDTGWSREQLLDRLCQEKVGVNPRAWQTPAARLYTFESLTVGPVPFMVDANPMPQPAQAAPK
jgi:AmmeMemoRadiSam system protein A